MIFAPYSRSVGVTVRSEPREIPHESEHTRRFPSMGYPKMDGLYGYIYGSIRETPLKMDDLGVPLF